MQVWWSKQNPRSNIRRKGFGSSAYLNPLNIYGWLSPPRGEQREGLVLYSIDSPPNGGERGEGGWESMGREGLYSFPKIMLTNDVTSAIEIVPSRLTSAACIFSEPASLPKIMLTNDVTSAMLR